MRKKILILSILIWCIGYANAQKKWSLEECINYAFENNIQIKQSQINTETNKVDLLQKKMNILPSISASSSHMINYGNKFDIYTNLYTKGTVKSDNFSLSSNMNLFSGFQQINSIKQSAYELKASKYNSDKIRNDMAIAITGYYLQILYSKELVDVAKEQVKITHQQIDRTKKLVEAGTLAKGSLLDIQSQSATEELNLINAQNQLNMAYLDLIQLLDLKSTDDFEILEPDINIEKNLIIDKTNKIYSSAVNIMPEIKSAEFYLKSYQKSVDIAKGARYPSLSLFASLETRYSDANKITNVPITDPNFGKVISFNDQIDNNLFKYLGVSLSIPIFNKYNTTSNIKKAKLAANNAEYSLQLKKNQLFKDIEQAHADALAAFKQFEAYEKSLKAFEESFHYAQQKFNIGMLNSVDYNISKNNFAKAKSNLIQAKYNYLFKIKILDFYIGKPLTI